MVSPEHVEKIQPWMKPLMQVVGVFVSLIVGFVWVWGDLDGFHVPSLFHIYDVGVVILLWASLSIYLIVLSLDAHIAKSKMANIRSINYAS